jgi:hypothetical protein
MLVRQFEEKRLSARSRYRWEDSEMTLKKQDVKARTGLILLRMRPSCGLLNMEMNLRVPQKAKHLLTN